MEDTLRRTNGERDSRRIMNGVGTFRGPLLPRDRRRDRPLPRSLERWSGFVAIAAAHAVEERYAAIVRNQGISLRDFVLLVELARHQGISQSHLAHRVGLGRSRVSEQLTVLDTAGYVSRELNQLDLRKRRIWISWTAQQIVEDLTEQITKVDNGWLSPLEPRHERPAFVAALRRLPPAVSERQPATTSA
jgi:DNA-binding MarR family transcriptional regulator